MSYLRDNRTENQYKKTCKDGWLGEDHTFELIKNNLPIGYSIHKTGIDSNRKFLTGTSRKNIKSTEDFTINTPKGNSIFIGHQTSQTSIKYLSPKEKEQVQPIILKKGFSITYRKVFNDFIVFDFSDEKLLSENNKIYPNFKMGNKLTRLFDEEVVNKHKYADIKDVLNIILKEK